MKKTLRLTAVTVLTMGILIACNTDEADDSSSSDANNQETNSDTQEDNSEDEETKGETGSSEGLTDKIGSDDEKNTDDEEDNSGPNLGEGSTEDQLDLRIGDTGQIETSLNMFELTINSVEILDEINGETPEIDKIILTDVTLKNLSDTTMDISEALDVIEITSMLEGSGFPDFSKYYDSVETLEGQLNSGEEIKGQLVFEENESDEYFIRVSEGLIAAGGAKNQAIWTFTKEEAE